MARRRHGSSLNFATFAERSLSLATDGGNAPVPGEGGIGGTEGGVRGVGPNANTIALE